MTRRALDQLMLELFKRHDAKNAKAGSVRIMTGSGLGDLGVIGAPSPSHGGRESAYTLGFAEYSLRTQPLFLAMISC
jgi:hypothetical protein